MSADTLTLPALWSVLSSRARAVEEEAQPPDVARYPRPPEVRIHVCNDAAEASFLSVVLEDMAIAHRLDGEGYDPYGMLFVPQRGYATVVVSESDVAEARGLIAEALSAPVAEP